MFEITVKINGFEKVKRFSESLLDFHFSIELTDDCIRISAKSIIGIFTLNLCKPLKLIVDTEDTNQFYAVRDAVKEFLD